MRHQQAEWRCALPGFRESTWGPPPRDGYHMGALPILEGPDTSEEPKESHEDGCPGAWYRARFVLSLLPYERSQDANGGYSENLRLTRCADPLVLDAIQYLEHERSRALNHWRERMQG
jgi:hypothetical protein